jgi:hypothetical protein
MQHDDDEDMIYPGDLVELVVQPSVWGQAIGFAGSLVFVRLNAVTVLPYHEFELRKMAGQDPDPKGGLDADNVVDFTKSVADLKKAKTRGVA